MNNKTLTKISISVIAVLLIAVLAVTMSVMLGEQAESVVSAATEETLMYATYNGTNGQITDDEAVDGHYTQSQIAAQLGVSAGEVMAITTGTELYNYINGSYPNNYAFLANDVAIAYNVDKSGYDKVSANNSNALFTKYLDGNGYTVSIEAGSGDGVGYKDNINLGNTNKDDSRTGNYWYMGYLCAVNQGTIKNLTVDFSSNHGIIQGAVSNPASLCVPNGAQVIAGAGVVTGINKGTIDNVRVNLNSVFGVYMKPGGDRTLFENTAYVGGIAGVMTAGTISNTQVDIATDGGVSVFVEGQEGTWGRDHNTGSVAGGILGKLQQGDATVEYCALTGSGRVFACSNTSRGEAKQSYAAGAIATSRNIAGHVIFDEATVNEGQIKGIVSSWTGQREDNWDNNYKSVKGLLFDAVGKNVQSCAVLYNLNLLTKSEGGTEYSTLDSSGEIDNWTEIYPSSTGGSVYVRYETSTVLYDIRIEAVADGHDDEKDSISDFDMTSVGTAYHKYFMPNGQTGKIIWSGVFDKNGSVTNHINMDVDQPIYAEIYMLKSADYGKFNYTFGTMGTITYTDNGNYVNGKNTKGYEGAAGVLKLPTANFVGADQAPTGDYYWEVYRDGVATDITQSYMPGTYTIRTAHKLGTNTYGYFNEADRMIAWQSSQDYKFTITQGVFSYDESNTTQDQGWVSEFKFTLGMDRANDFDMMRYQQNGIFADEEIVVEDTEKSVTFTTKQGTGKNGMQYTFYAYKFDDILQDYVLVAVSTSKTVKIDNEAPEIYDVRYFTEDALGNRTEVTEAVLNSWQKDKVIVTYTLTDNGKSGLGVVPSDDGVSNVASGSDYNVEITFKEQKTYTLEYTDVAGNSVVFEVSAMVDINPGTLSVRDSGYNPSYGTYDYDGFDLFCNTSIGQSGWTLYVSDSVDENGEPIWKEMGAIANDDSVYTVDWNIGDYTTYTPADFRVKMVNDAGLYDDVYANATADGIIGQYCVYVKMADFYVDISLEAIVDSYNNTLAEILALNPNYFNKVYDSTQSYTGAPLTIDLSKTDGVIMVNTDVYAATPVVPDFTKIKLELEYERASIGTTNIRMWAVLEGDDDFKFDVWFADLDGDYKNNAQALYSVPAQITKLQVTVNLADYLASSFEYGDEIPTYVDAAITADETAKVDLITNAVKGAGVGTYSVEGKLSVPNDSIDITIQGMSVQIVAKPVFVDIRYDGSQNVPTKFQFSGKTPQITASFKDVITGESVMAKVDYFLIGDDGSRTPMSGFIQIGKFEYVISTGNANYVVDGKNNFEMTVVKGYIQIQMGVQNTDYTGENKEYKLNLTNEQLEFFEEGDIVINYYRYNEGAYYDSAKGEMVGSYDLNPTKDTASRGFYKVEVVINANDYFYGQTYGKDGDLGLLIVNVADTVITAEPIVVYSYDDLKHTYDLVKGKVQVKSVEGKQTLWDSSMPADGAIVVNYFDKTTGEYLPIDLSEDKAYGWFLAVDSYSFRIEYVGTDNYAPCSIDVMLQIDKAEFKNVEFIGTTGVYNGKTYKVTQNIPDEYKNSTISYYYNGRAYNSLEDIYATGACVKVGTYRISLRMSRDNYNSLSLDATITISNAKLNVSAKTLVDTYTGEPFYLQFEGLEERDGQYYYIDHGTEVLASVSGSVVAINAGKYYGTVTIFVNNYEILELETYMEIYPASIVADKASITLPDRLPSGVPVSDYYGTYTIDGVEKNGNLLYYTKDETTGNLTLVTPNEDGILPDGIYTVFIEVDNNHNLENSWELKIGQINDNTITPVGWAVIGVVGALMLAAIITAIVTVNKRKKRGIV